MTNLNDVLLAMSNIPVDDPIAEIWGRGLQGGGYTVIEYTGALPITITANGEPLIDYRIYGNTVQDGTPTPENPIIPIGCGERTENLFSVDNDTAPVSPEDIEFINLVKSSESPAEYVPYGYKLPMTVSDGNKAQTIPVYLGEVETTRRIKKLVLTGEEDLIWGRSTSRNYSWYIFPYSIGAIAYTPFYCSHGETVTDVSDFEYGTVYCDNTLNLGIFDSSINSLTKLSNYFAQQYANGTPVTVWYVLAEPETGIVNEPLMKIGDYADTLSMEQAGASIPTFSGTTVIDYDGTLKPSEMYIKYLEVKND